MPPTSPKTVAIGQLIGAVSLSALSDMNLVRGVQNVMRSNPSFWLQFIFAPAFMAVVIFLCRKIVKAIP
jgi:hypothetical protein